jgi:hypothetical protein
VTAQRSREVPSRGSEWRVGLAVLLVGFAVIAWLAAPGPSPDDLTLAGVVGLALLVTLPLAPFLAIGAGVLARPGWGAAIGRWMLVVGLACWCALWALLLSAAVDGSLNCGSPSGRACGAPMTYHLAALVPFAVTYAGAWVLARWTARLEFGRSQSMAP